MAFIEAVQTEQGLERRQANRHGVRYLRFYSPVPGSVLNLSEEGMCLETVAILRPGIEYLLRIRRDSLLFCIRGEVKWCHHRSTLASSTGKALELFRSGIGFRGQLPAETLEFLTTEATTD